MNTEPTQTQFLAGHYVSESAVRGVFSPRPRTPPTTPTDPVTTGAADSLTDSLPSAPPGGLRPRRRWSVADL